MAQFTQRSSRLATLGVVAESLWDSMRVITAWVSEGARGWGALLRPIIHRFNERTIPTRVGSTLTVSSNLTVGTDHPHAGGEHVTSRAASAWVAGPSPRGWGARYRALQFGQLTRTIPTRVGSTLSPSPDEREWSDHPHAGGEHHTPTAKSQPRAGPSPRGWGALVSKRTDRARLRTIPTRVGSTAKKSPTSSANTDHPHAGGEHHVEFPDNRVASGPSPRGWGAQTGQRNSQNIRRTIPTRVGSTVEGVNRFMPEADHPHAGGEHCTGRINPRRRVGPSPRGWGEPPPPNSKTDRRRTIPTRVGSTVRPRPWP